MKKDYVFQFDVNKIIDNNDIDKAETYLSIIEFIYGLCNGEGISFKLPEFADDTMNKEDIINGLELENSICNNLNILLTSMKSIVEYRKKNNDIILENLKQTLNILKERSNYP